MTVVRPIWGRVLTKNFMSSTSAIVRLDFSSIKIEIKIMFL